MTAPQGGVTSYIYDGPLVTQESFEGATSGAPDASLQWVFDSEGRLASQTVNSANPITELSVAASRMWRPLYGALGGRQRGAIPVDGEELII